MLPKPTFSTSTPLPCAARGGQRALPHDGQVGRALRACRGAFHFPLVLSQEVCGACATDHPKRTRPPHDVPQWVPEDSFFFITINCQPPAYNQLCRTGIGDALFAAAVYYHTHLLWHCRLMLLKPDHLHGIIGFPSQPGMKTTVTDWKRYVARSQGIEWQRDFFDHRLRDHYEEGAKTDYILKNPARKGLCERAEEWPWVYHPTDRLPPRLGA